MKKIFNEIEDILNLIYSGNFSQNDIGMLFIYLRNIEKVDEIIRELGDFIAHSDGRDNGKSHGKIKEFIHNILQVSATGGTVLGKKTICKRATIIKQLVAILNKNIKSFDKSKFENHKDLIISHLFEKLDGIEFQFKDINVNRCFLKNDIDKMSFCFNIVIKSGVIQMGPDVLWCNNLID